MYSPSKNSVVSKKHFSFLVQKHSQRYYDLTQNKTPFSLQYIFIQRRNNKETSDVKPYYSYPRLESSINSYNQNKPR